MDTMFHLKDSTLVAELCGEIDHHVCDKIREDIDKELELYEINHLIFDFSDVTFMDSSGIGVVLGRYKKLKKIGGTVTIRNASRLVKQILDMSGIFTLMEYEEEEEEDGK
ncbi:anti-sigma F factor antagonist [Anaerovoracaceae bacterium 42-11]|nr:anti-sigma F factor antagonist [Emergencia sp.]